MSTERKRPDHSMTLLREVIERPLDQGYADAARRRATGAAPRPARWRRLIGVVLAAARGFGAVWAARELRAPTDGAGEARALLMSQIEQGMSRGEQLRTDNSALVAEIDQLQQESLGASGPQFLDRVR